MDKKESKLSLDSVVDFIFGLKKTHVLIILITLLGLVLRLIAAINTGVTADDMHFVTHAVNFLGADRLVTYDQSSGLWFAFTSAMYSLFGTTQLTSRLAALLFGSFTIPVIYLLTAEFFNKKIGLIAAFLLAISPFHIKLTMAEMDPMTMFFVMAGMLFFVRALKKEKPSLYIIAGIFMGLSIYTKVYPLLFVPSLLLFFLYYKKKHRKQIISKTNIKNILVFLVIAGLFAIPALTHNHLLYKDKGFLDLQFTRTLNLGRDVSAQYYSWDPIWDRSNSWSGLFFGDTNHITSGEPLLLGAVGFIRTGDPVLFYLGLLGIVLLLFNKKMTKEYLFFLIFGVLFALPFLGSIILLAKHFLFIDLLLIPLAAFAVFKINDKISEKTKKDVLKIIIVILLLSSLILLGMRSTGVAHFYGKSHIGQTIDFKEKNIGDSDLIVVDDRIYTGRTNWMFYGKPYLSATQFAHLVNNQDSLPGPARQVNVYYAECILDDCGWGTIKNQPQLNETMEGLTAQFSGIGQLRATISEPNRNREYLPLLGIGNKNEILNIYSLRVQIKDSIVAAGSQPKNWFLYSIGYTPKENQFDYYETHGSIDSLLNSVAHLIKIIALILAFASLFFIAYITLRK